MEKVTMTRDGRIVAVCQRDGVQERIDILDFPLPKPAPVCRRMDRGIQLLAQKPLSERIPAL